jgi:hypothetical protein
MLTNIQTTTTLNVGDKAYADFGKYSRVEVREGTVIKKSAIGVVQIDFGISSPVSFMTNGFERGGTMHDKAFLITKDQYDQRRPKMETQQRERTAQRAVKTAYDIPAMTANKVALIDALKAALAAVEAI